MTSWPTQEQIRERLLVGGFLLFYIMVFPGQHSV